MEFELNWISILQLIVGLVGLAVFYFMGYYKGVVSGFCDGHMSGYLKGFVRCQNMTIEVYKLKDESLNDYYQGLDGLAFKYLEDGAVNIDSDKQV